MRVAALVMLLGAGQSLAKAAGKGKATFTEYDLPLYEQIVDRMGHEIAERLGTGRLTHDRYFIVPFAYQNARNNPKYSHSFITAIRVLPQGKKYTADSEHAVEEYRSWNFETR